MRSAAACTQQSPNPTDCVGMETMEKGNRRSYLAGSGDGAAPITGVRRCRRRKSGSDKTQEQETGLFFFFFLEADPNRGLEMNSPCEIILQKKEKEKKSYHVFFICFK